MRPLRLATALLGIGFAVGTLACESDPTRVVYMDVSYQVRCLDCTPRVPDESAHPIKNVDGENGLSLECRVNLEDDVRRVSFSAQHSGYSFDIDKANLDGAESEGPCQVTLVEGDNTYQGLCGSDEPTTDRPCSINLEVDDGVIKGEVYCARITNLATTTDYRYVTQPATRDPAKFQVYGCKNL